MSKEISEHVEIYGPMWQAHCHRCDEMMDVVDTPSQAREDAVEHDCMDRIFWGIRLRSGVFDVKRKGNVITLTLNEEDDEVRY